MLKTKELITLFLRSNMFRAKVDNSVTSFKLKLKMLDHVKTIDLSTSRYICNTDMTTKKLVRLIFQT